MAGYDPWGQNSDQNRADGEVAGTARSTLTGWPTTITLPPPTDPMGSGRELLKASGRAGKLRFWRGDWYQWISTRWDLVSEASVSSLLYRLTEAATYQTDEGLKPWSPNRKKVADVQHALAHGIVYRDDRRDEDTGGKIPLANGVLDLDELTLTPHSPTWFNLHSLDFDFDEDAACPTWKEFLSVALEDDAERIALLQEWFGYVLCGGTELQKAITMFGPPRSGKGTVIRILRAMVGEQYTSAPASLDSLAGTFGLEPLIGKRLVTFGDVQWTGRNLNEVVGILLGITGEDAIDVHRKNRRAWTGTLATRFLFSGNDMPRFNNTSSALANRFVYLRFRISMLGREDHTLTSRLMREISGIFNWSLVGWARLTNNHGVFTESALGREALESVRRYASPIGSFLTDMCVVEPGAQDALDVLHSAYEDWCKREGLTTSSKPAFARGLMSASGLTTKRVGSARAGRRQMVYGARLATLADETPETVDQARDQADQASMF